MRELVCVQSDRSHQVAHSSANTNTLLIDHNIKRLVGEQTNQQKRFYSIEVMPIDGVNLLNFDGLLIRPLFTSITWLADTNIKATRMVEAPSIQLANALQRITPILSHISCTQLTEAKLADVLATNVQNVLALRGDQIYDEQPLRHAIDLVRTLRLKADPGLTIAVAGYPQMHPDATSARADLDHLKAKVDAGADFIITQFCFSFETLSEYIKACRALGIVCPIIPGILVPTSHALLLRMIKFCRVSLPDELLRQYAALADNPAEFMEFAFENAYRLIEQLFQWEYERIGGIHIFTINRFETVNRIVMKFRRYFGE